MHRPFTRPTAMLVQAGDLARRSHSTWLTRALGGQRVYPRIPTRPDWGGGFDRLRARANGAELAERWWATALHRVDD